jgi:hypothetical protein
LCNNKSYFSSLNRLNIHPHPFRDEDGKTPLDKARERNDDGHREVAGLLQSPGDWIVAPEAGGGASSAAPVEPAAVAAADPVGPKGRLYKVS